MSIGLKDHKLLWARGGNRCAICRTPLVIDENELDAASLIGVEAHIVAEKPDGPRGDSPMSPQERNKYSNLVLLCGNHHKEIDDQTATYPVQRLHEVKIAHEKWVTEALDSAATKQALTNDLLYIDIILEWDRLMNLADWTRWTSDWFQGGEPTMRREERERLYEAKTFIFNRVWPGTNQELEDAFHSFRHILNDLLRLFDHFSERCPGDAESLQFAKFHKRGGNFNPNYDRDQDEYLFYIYSFEDLGLEITRCANQICEIVRKTIQPYYRRDRGALIVMLGPNMRMEYVNQRTEYRPGEKYRGLAEFYSDRKTRDIYLVEPEDAEPENPWH
jgi:hypothetical protein